MCLDWFWTDFGQDFADITTNRFLPSDRQRGEVRREHQREDGVPGVPRRRRRAEGDAQGEVRLAHRRRRTQ